MTFKSVFPERNGPVTGFPRGRTGPIEFPFCIYASGKFTSAGGLLLGAVKPGVDVHDVHSDKDLLPAEMLANASGSDSLVLEGDSTIVGSPKTPGAARVGARVKVLKGEVQSGARAQDAPIVPISEYDPAGRPGLQTLAQSSFSVREPMSGLVRFSGPQLTFNQGLELKGGVLFVEGNLTVGAGGIRGQGAVVCTGNVTITGSSDLAADSCCAVVAGGDVSLAGSGQDGSYYQGLLYAGGQGGISVSGVTLLGAAVASHPSGATVEMHDARVVFDPQVTHVTADVGFSGGVYPPGGFPVQDPVTFATTYLRLKALPGQAAGTVPTPAQLAAAGFPPLTVDNFELVPADGDVGQAFRVAYDRYIRPMNDAIAAVKQDDPLLPGGKFDFDLNRFVKVADRLRMIWRN